MTVKYPCVICNRAVAKNHKGIQCDTCDLWVHIKCNNTSITEYNHLVDDDSLWSCRPCLTQSIPFKDISNENLKQTLQGKNINDPILTDFNCDTHIEFIRDVDTALLQLDDEMSNNET